MSDLKYTAKKLMEDKKNFFLIAIGIILISIFLLFIVRKEIIICFDEYPSNVATQIFYDIGTGYSQENSTISCTTYKTHIALPKEYISVINKMRIDFSNREGLLSIKKIELCKNGFPLLVFDANAIAEMIEGTENIEYHIDQNRLVINNLTNDGQVFFNDAFVQCVKDIYAVPQPVEIVLAVFLLCIFSILLYLREKIYVMISALSQRNRFILILFVFTLGVFWCYRDYIFGNIVFVFGGIASDSISQTYPNMYRLAHLIENGESLFRFDFTRGYGAYRGINAVNIFDWVILFGTKNFTYLMGINQICKIILSFVLFHIYLKLINRKEVACYIGAASYALCGHMIIRQFWKSYSNEVVLSAFLLIALELSINKKKHALLPIALLLYFTSMGEYNSVLAFGLVVGYTIFRYIEQYGLDMYGMLKATLCNICAYILAAFGGFLYLFQPLMNSLGTDRAKNGMSSFDIKELFRLQNVNDIRLEIIRTVSAGLEGKEELFHAVEHENILEGATFYCGIITLLFISFAIYKLKGSRKILAFTIVVIAIAYIIFPELRFMANGFGTYAYKLSSFWIVILMLYYGTLGIDLWMQDGTEKRYYLVYCFHIVIATASILIVSQEMEKVDFNYAMLFMLIGTIVILDIIMLFRDKIRPRNVAYALMLLSYMELFSNAYIFARSDMSQTQDGVDRNYKDSSIDYIKEIDKSKLFRIEHKDHRSQTNVGLVLDYNGFVDYSGGASMNDNIHHFLEVMNIARIQPASNHYMTGLSNANELYDILSAKYVVTSEKAIDNDYGLKLLCEKDGKKIYENCNMLSIGFCYSSFIEEEALKELKIQERRFALLDSCVLNADVAARISGLNKAVSQAYKRTIMGEELTYEYDAELHKISFAEVDSDKVIELTFDMEGRSNSFGALNYGNVEERLGSVSIGSKETLSSQSFVFTGNNISYFQCGSEMNDIHIVVYDKDAYYKMADQYLQERKKSQFNCKDFMPNYISGTVNSEEDSILYFSIPYDKGWNIYIDGEKADLLQVNYGFIGAYLKAGEHDVVLDYQVPYLRISIIISMIGIAAIVVWCVYWQRREKWQVLNTSTIV